MTRRALRRALFFLPVACLACQTGPRVETDRLEGASLADYQAFAVSPELASGDDPAFGPSARAAAEEALVTALLPRGLAHVDDGSADLLLAVGVVSERTTVDGGRVVVPMRPEVVTTRSGVATPVGNVPLRESRRVGPPVMVEQPLPDAPITRCHVVVDAFDAKTKKHLWRGSSRCRRYPPGRLDLDGLRRSVTAIAGELPRD